MKNNQIFNEFTLPDMWGNHTTYSVLLMHDCIPTNSFHEFSCGGTFDLKTMPSHTEQFIIAYQGPETIEYFCVSFFFLFFPDSDEVLFCIILFID